jgi:acyl-CoA thioester hydrolase
MSFTLTDKIELKIKFNECDPLGIVWHGHYVGYFEDGREAFGEKYGLRYLDFYDSGFVVPIVSLNCSYKKMLRYGDSAILETHYVDNPAAKIHFHYKMYVPVTHELIAEATSVQVFLDVQNMQLQLSTPDFFETWKKQHTL